MGSKHTTCGGTRESLLKAACEVFAEKGYRDARVADICRRADANIAAINYHFGGKESLYAMAWQQAFQESLKAHPFDGGVPADAPPEQRLYGQIASFVRRITDPASREFDIVQRELANPTGLLGEVMQKCIQPIRRQMKRIVRELLGERASDRQVQLCQMSIMAQCLHVMMRRRHRDVSGGSKRATGPPFLKFSVTALTEHIVRFSLAGIREMRRQIESGESDHAK